MKGKIQMNPSSCHALTIDVDGITLTGRAPLYNQNTSLLSGLSNDHISD